MTRRKKWLAWMALVLLAGLAGQQGLPYVFRWRPVRAFLRSRLEPRLAYAFGRPVEVGDFDISLLHGLRLQANSITVAEDPRFGQEYFLRADSLTAGLDWWALWRGRLRFVRFTFESPSLNVVVAPDGAWNVESWLESRASAGNAWARGATAPERPRQIVVRAGRINFKRRADKLPFALVGVDGALSPENDGMWRMEFEARLLRAGVALQEAGTLQFLGRLPEAGAFPPALPAGARRLSPPPAQFDLSWQQASLSDALRLVFGQDFGVRGRLEGTLSVRGPEFAREPAAAPADEAAPLAAWESGAWSYRAVLRLGAIHRWDLPVRPDNPGVNFAVEGIVAADRSRWEFKKVSLEAPRSSLRASGVFVRDLPGETQFRFLSSSISLDDLFAWYRAFHAGVADRATLDGTLGVDVEAAGWPPRIERGALATDGARFAVPGEKNAFALGRAALHFTPKGAEFSPLTLALPEEGETARITAKVFSTPGFPIEFATTGDTARVEQLFTAAAALGLTQAHGWRAEGSVRARLRWQGSLIPWRAAPSGTVEMEDVNFAAGALAQSVHVTRARVELTAAERRISFSQARFLGAQWNGTIRAKTFAGPWVFALNADHLDTAGFARWFPPPAGTASPERALPADQNDPLKIAWPEGFAASGKLSVGDLAIGRQRMSKLTATASVANRRLELSPAQAEFYGGRVRGSFRAGFDPVPRYDVEALFDHVNLSPLFEPHPTLRGCCSGIGSGAMTLSADGMGREAILKSIHGRGTAEILRAGIHSLDLKRSIESGSAQEGATDFSEKASAKFVFGSSKTTIEVLSLSGGQGSVAGTGTVTFSGALDLDLKFTPPRAASAAANPAQKRIRLAGTLAAPKIAPAAAP